MCCDYSTHLHCLTNERVIYMLQYNSVGVQPLPNIASLCRQTVISSVVYASSFPTLLMIKYKYTEQCERCVLCGVFPGSATAMLVWWGVGTQALNRMPNYERYRRCPSLILRHSFSCSGLQQRHAARLSRRPTQTTAWAACPAPPEPVPRAPSATLPADGTS